MGKYYILGILCSIITGILIATGLFFINLQGSFFSISGSTSPWDFFLFIIGCLLALPGGILAGFIRGFRDKKAGKSINSPKSIRKIVLLGVALSITSFILFGALASFIFFAYWVDAIT